MMSTAHVFYPNIAKKAIFLLYCAHLFVPLSDARRYFRSTIKTKKMAFCFVLCSLIRTFANDLVNH